MKLTSNAFGHNEMIPRRFTCQGADVSPALNIAEIPEEAGSLVLIMDDPDAPGTTFDHWILYDIPADTRMIAEDSSPGTPGTNGFGETAYGGPCPPSGTHRYFFKVFALDEPLNLPEGLYKDDVEKAMTGHIVEQAQLVGRYAKS